MKTFKEFYDEQETINESASEVIGKTLGIGTSGLLTAWIASLLFKGGVGVVNSFANTFGKAKAISFKKNFKETVKDSPSVKDQINKTEALKKKYEEDLGTIVDNIKEKKWEEAVQEFNELPADKKHSTEITNIIVSEIITVTKSIPIAEPTPGNECYRALKLFVGMSAAKAISKAMIDQATKYVQEQGND